MSKIRIINTVCLNFVKLRVFTLDAVLILSFLVFLVFPFIRVCDRLSAFVTVYPRLCLILILWCLTLILWCLTLFLVSDSVFFLMSDCGL